MVNARNEQLCSQLEGCKFIDLSAPFKDRGGAQGDNLLYSSDRVHLNEDGYNCLADMLMDYIYR